MDRKETEMMQEIAKQMTLGNILRWAGPAGIGFGVFLVFSAMSGMPINIPFVTAPNDGFEVVSGGVVLWAVTMLLVGMVGLYARNTDPRAPKVISWDEIEEEDDMDEALRKMIEEEKARSRN